MKRLLSLFLFMSIILGASAQNDKRTVVKMETNMGDITIELYNETPLHSENFKKLVKEGVYDSLLFHRVINDFMIQGGDPDSKNAEKGQMLGEGNMGYLIDAEFRTPEIYHKRGALAMAREGDATNPERRSSSSQFYIVTGRVFNDAQLDRVQERIDKGTVGKLKLTPEMRETYKTIGGTPHLDGQYSIFGEVTEGMDIIDKIQKVATDEFDRPLEDVRIIKAYIVE